MPRFDATITLGNILTALTFAGGAVVMAYGTPGDLMKAQAKITALEVANVGRDARELRFETDVRQDLADIKSEARELRDEVRALGRLRWTELPPSPYHRDVLKNK